MPEIYDRKLAYIGWQEASDCPCVEIVYYGFLAPYTWNYGNQEDVQSDTIKKENHEENNYQYRNVKEIACFKSADKISPAKPPDKKSK